MITDHEKYDLGQQIGRAVLAKADSMPLRKQVGKAGGWDTDVQQGYDDALRQHVQERRSDTRRDSDSADI